MPTASARPVGSPWENAENRLRAHFPHIREARLERTDERDAKAAAAAEKEPVNDVAHAVAASAATTSCVPVVEHDDAAVREPAAGAGRPAQQRRLLGGLLRGGLLRGRLGMQRKHRGGHQQRQARGGDRQQCR